MAKQSGWVTINGVHVFIDGKSGKITQGPAKFIGSTLNDLPSNKSSQTDLKARLQAKKAEKSQSSNKSKTEAEKVIDKSYKRAESLNLDKMSSSELRERYIKTDKMLKETVGPTIDQAWRDGFTENKKISKILESRGEKVPDTSAEKDKGRLVTQKRRSSLILGKDTDYSKLTKSEIQKGMKEIEREIKIEQSNYKDPYMISALEDIWGKADLALGNKSYAKSSPKNSPKTGNSTFDSATKVEKVKATTPISKQSGSTTPKTGNALFDNATKSNKATSGKSSSGLSVVHYDGFGRRGSWNEYKINDKKVSAKEARKQFSPPICLTVRVDIMEVRNNV